jgi:hypothetical protein
MPMIVDGVKTAGLAIGGLITRNPQLLLGAASSAAGMFGNSAGNMVNGSSGPLRLTSRQQSILAAAPHSVPHTHGGHMNAGYVTIWSVQGQDNFQWTCVSLNEDEYLCCLPIPLFKKFVVYPSEDPLTGRSRLMAEKVAFLETARFVSSSTGWTQLSYDNYTDTAQELLDILLNQSPPLSDSEMEVIAAERQLQIKVEELFEKIPTSAWLILRDKGRKPFNLYVIMTFGHEWEPVLVSPPFVQRTSVWANEDPVPLKN